MLNAPFFYALRQVDWKLLTIVASKKISYGTYKEYKKN